MKHEKLGREYEVNPLIKKGSRGLNAGKKNPGKSTRQGWMGAKQTSLDSYP